MRLRKGHSGGTHRAVAPEVTLERITPFLRSFGITRCADVTGLDTIGIPVYCAVRPEARTVQVSNGKGLRPVDARVSALMEAIELSCAENPVRAFRRDSARELALAGEPYVAPADLPGFNADLVLDERSRIDWVVADDLLTGERRWLPASAAYYQPERSLYRWTSNGLASGNHATEATLHALYEVLERHTLSQLVKGSRLSFVDVDVLDLDTVADEPVAELVALVRDAGLALVLLRPRTGLPVHTFMAVLLDPTPFGLSLRVDPGYGAHLDPAVAAIRAITEAAQGRLSVIHGSREDLSETTYRDDPHESLYRFFSRLAPRARWGTLESCAGEDLDDDYQTVLGAARMAGFPAVYRVSMEGPGRGPEIAAVKVLIPGALDTFPV